MNVYFVNLGLIFKGALSLMVPNSLITESTKGLLKINAFTVIDTYNVIILAYFGLCSEASSSVYP